MALYLSQPNPLTARWEREDHLRDPKFQLDAFRVSCNFFHFCHYNCVSMFWQCSCIDGFYKLICTVPDIPIASNCCCTVTKTLQETWRLWCMEQMFKSSADTRGVAHWDSHPGKVHQLRAKVSFSYFSIMSPYHFICLTNGYLCSCPDQNTRHVLKLVCDLYALDRIWNYIGTYRNDDYVAPNKAKVCFVPCDLIFIWFMLVGRRYMIGLCWAVSSLRQFTSWQSTWVSRWEGLLENLLMHLIFPIMSLVLLLGCHQKHMLTTHSTRASSWQWQHATKQAMCKGHYLNELCYFLAE